MEGKKKLPRVPFNADYFFLLIGLILLGFFFYSETIFLFPSFIHAWTQSDRLALALGFIDNDFNFFKPETFNLITREGVTGVDFPIHEYLVALLMKVFGSENPTLFRFYTLCYCSLGYLALYKLTKQVTRSAVNGVIVVVFVYTCPIITYYQIGFIPSSTALSSIFIGYMFYFQFIETRKVKHISLAIGFMTLAALTRTPFNIILFAVFCQQAAGYLRKKKIMKKEIIIFLMAYGCILGWNFYKGYLNKEYGTQFLTTLLPAENFADLKKILHIAKDRWTIEFLTFYHYLLLAIVATVFIVAKFVTQKKQPFAQELIIQGILILIGGLAYFFLMAKQYADHDYYLIDSFYCSIFLLLIFGLNRITIDNYQVKGFFQIMLIFILSGCLFKSKQVQNVRYTEALWDRVEITRKNFQNSAQLLDSLGIPKEARMLVIDAHSTNIPLILMKRKGYTVLTTSEEKIKESFLLDFENVVIQDTFLLSDAVFNYPELINRLDRIGGNGKISIYTMAKPNSVRTLCSLISNNPPAVVSSIDFENSGTLLNCNQVNLKTSKGHFSNIHSCFLSKETEFGPTFEMEKKEEIFNKILFEGRFYFTETDYEIKIAASIIDNSELKYYWDFKVNPKFVNEWIPYRCIFTLPKKINSGSIIKCYIWNFKKSELHCDDINITFFQDDFRQME